MTKLLEHEPTEYEMLLCDERTLLIEIEKTYKILNEYEFDMKIIKEKLYAYRYECIK